MSERSQHILNRVVLVLISALFVWSATTKFLDMKNFFLMVENYKMTSTVVAMLMALVLPPLELILGVGIIIPAVRRESFLLLMTLMLLFTVAVLIAWMRGLEIDCGCFQSQVLDVLGAGKVGYQKVILNVCLLAILFFLYVRTTSLNQ